MCIPDKLSKSARCTTVKSLCTTPYEEVFTLDKLFEAYRQVRKGKGHRDRVQHYDRIAGDDLPRLLHELQTFTYKPKPCTEFYIWCTAGQKRRLVQAPAYRDLIVQRVLYNLLYPVFNKGFIYDSYGCRTGKGAMRAADRVHKFMRQAPADSYYLQIDIRKYYYSMSRSHIREALERRITDSRIVDLILSYTQDVGVCVGSILAQFFGMLYLDVFDHYVKRVLKIKHYVRYVDDMVFVGLSKQQAHDVLSTAQQRLSGICLRLSKWHILPIRRGINFCGYRMWQRMRFIRKRSLHVFARRLKAHAWQAIESILGYAEPTASYRHLRKLLAGVSCLMPEHILRRLNNGCLFI